MGSSCAHGRVCNARTSVHGGILRIQPVAFDPSAQSVYVRDKNVTGLPDDLAVSNSLERVNVCVTLEVLPRSHRVLIVVCADGKLIPREKKLIRITIKITIEQPIVLRLGLTTDENHRRMSRREK
jgi:hypothetical protein